MSVDWNQKDTSLLLSCGKDNRISVWDTMCQSIIGDLDIKKNWTFDGLWCPTNPAMCVAASYDGTVGVYSLLGEDVIEEAGGAIVKEYADPNDPFANVGTPHVTRERAKFVMPRPPNWLRRPIGAAWSNCGSLVSFQSGTSIVSVKTMSLNGVAEAMNAFEEILSSSYENLSRFCGDKSIKDGDIWKYLKCLCSADIRADLAVYFAAGNESTDLLLATVTKQLDLKVQASPESQVSNDRSKEFSIFPNTDKNNPESQLDSVITQLVVSGDFSTAVSLAIKAERYADALLLAASGSPELIYETQQAYFKHRDGKSYIRILNSIVAGNLIDIVTNAEISFGPGKNNEAWKTVLAIACRFAPHDDTFGDYFAILGSRLDGSKAASIALVNDSTVERRPMQIKGTIHASSASKDLATAISYIGSSNMQKVSKLWADSLPDPKLLNSYTEYCLLLQQFIEKISIVRLAIGFVDPDLGYELELLETYPLSHLYEVYAVYCKLSLEQGCLASSLRIIELIPVGYSSSVVDLPVLRDLVYKATGMKVGLTGLDPPFPFVAVDIYGAPVHLEAVQQNFASINPSVYRPAQVYLKTLPDTHQSASGYQNAISFPDPLAHQKYGYQPPLAHNTQQNVYQPQPSDIQQNGTQQSAINSFGQNQYQQPASQNSFAQNVYSQPNNSYQLQQRYGTFPSSQPLNTPLAPVDLPVPSRHRNHGLIRSRW